MLRIPDIYPGPRVKKIQDLESRSKNLGIFNQTNFFLSSRKYDLGFIPDPDLDFLPILEPGSGGLKRHRIPDHGSGKLLIFALNLLQSISSGAKKLYAVPVVGEGVEDTCQGGREELEAQQGRPPSRSQQLTQPLIQVVSHLTKYVIRE